MSMTCMQERPEYMETPVSKKDRRWLYVTMPANIALGPASTFIALYILGLGGNVIEVSYAITLGYLVVIPASYMWGKVSDLYNNRKAQIFISYAGTAAGLGMIYFTQQIYLVIGLYGAIFFFRSAKNAPLNLLVMETGSKGTWAKGFSKYQMIMGIGTSLGLALSAVIAGLSLLRYLMLLLAGASAISAVLALRYVKGSGKSMRSTALLKDMALMFSRMMVEPILPLRTASPKMLRRWLSRYVALKKVSRSYVSMIFAGSFVFFLGTSLFNTVYAAGLDSRGLPGSQIFVIFFIAQLVQTYAFIYAGRRLAKDSKKWLTSRSLVLRGLSYALIGITFFVLAGTQFFGVDLILYLLAGGLAYSLYTVASNTLLFEAMNKIHRGTTLGMFSAVTGVAMLAGALASGYLAYYIGYGYVFMAAGALMLLASAMFAYLPKRMNIVFS